MEMIPVGSSNIAAVGYDDESGELVVEFISGGVYSYPGVTREVYDGLMSAPSKGRYFFQAIRGVYAGRRI
jgi:hypothetical protein